MKKSIICFLTALLTGWIFAIPAAADQFDRDTLQSVVVVYNEFDYQGERYSGYGTGFFVGETEKDPQFLVTNYHVVEYYIETGKAGAGGTLVVFFDADTYEEAYIVDYDAEMDIAVLRMGSPTELRKPLPLRIATEEMVGTPVYAIGYPGTSDAVGAISSLGASDATVTDGTISRLVVQAGTGRRVIHSTAVIHGGNSGGPLVDENGAVLGVNTFSYVDSETGESIEGSNYAVSVEELIPLLDGNQVPYEMWQEDSPLPVKWLVLGGVAAVVLIAAVAIALTMSRKRENKERLIEEGGSQEEKRPTVRSLAMQHSGMRVSLEDKTITIGRDPTTCQVAYQQNTPGVSKEHCSLRWDDSRQAFVVTDLKSTYGTFLMNGERLVPERPYYLYPGDGFYVGDRVNELRVELG